MPQSTFDAYWRGILQRNHPRAHPTGFIDEALNVAFLGGIPVSRPGIRPFHGADFAGTLRGLGWHVDASGVRELLAAASTDIQRCLPGGDPVTLSLANLPSTDQTRTEPERANFLSLSGGAGLTIIYDGVNQNLKWNGSNLTKLGIETAPTPAVPGTAGGGFLEAGTRNYVMTLNSATHESNPSDTPRVVTNNANEQHTVASPVDGVDYDDPQVLTWRLYRTDAGGAAYYFVGENGIGLTIVDGDVAADSDAIASANTPLEEFVNREPPAPAVAMAEHRGQVCAVFSDDLNLVRFSYFDPDYMVPEGWPADYVQPVAHGDGDEIKALASFHEWLVVFKENSTWAIIGTWPEVQLVPILASGGGKRIGIGCFAPGSILFVENAIMFASRDGIYKIERFESAAGGITATRLSGSIDALYAAAKFSLGAATSFDRKRRVFTFWGHG